jgi:outer membrane protein OmpA-like peptidoglycan-associated protein
MMRASWAWLFLLVACGGPRGSAPVAAPRAPAPVAADPDPDHDGILGPSDRCPGDAEDADGFEDEDGCPDPDNDGDGVADLQDQCPADAEDRDGFQDTDGCPDPDNDGDGVLDGADRCPDQAQVAPTCAAGQGCPDDCRVTVPDVDPVALTPFYFAAGRAEPIESTRPLVHVYAQVLRAHPEIAQVQIEGHVDDSPLEAKLKTLAERRAAWVRDGLVKDGIATERLVVRGFGRTRPIAGTDGLSGDALADARAKNRRVSLTVLTPP